MRQVLAIVSIALPVAIRAQGVVLVPILLTALLLKVLLDARASGRISFGSLVAGLRTYVVTLAVVGGAALAYIALKLVQGHGLSSGLSAYSGAAQAHYSLRDVARWSVLHLAELVFAVGVIPASALIVLAGLAWAVPRATQPRERVFLALTVATTFWMVLLVGAFASRYSLRIEERNMFYAEPLLLLAFVIWLDKGLPRPPRLTAAAVVVPAALLLSLPFESLFNLSLLGDTPGLIPLMRVAAHLQEGIDGVRVLLALGVLAAGVFFALVSRRWGMVLAPIGIALFLVFSSVTVLKAWAGQARATHASQGTNDLSWIDKTIGSDADAAFLFTPDFQADPHPLLQSEFWNRSVRRVFLLDAFDPNGYPAIPTTLSGAGRLDTAPGTRQPKYVVTAPGVDVDGKLLASTPRLALYRVASPLRLADRSSGLTADGWTGADATFTRYRPGAKLVFVDLSRPNLPVAPGVVRVELVSRGSVVETRRWVAAQRLEAFRFQAPRRLPFSVRSMWRRPSRLSSWARRHAPARGARERQGAAAMRARRDVLGSGRRHLARRFSTDEERSVTAEHWGEDAREKAEGEDWLGLYWQSHALTQQHINRAIAGGADENWVDFTKRRFFPKRASLALSLGCGVRRSRAARARASTSPSASRRSTSRRRRSRSRGRRPRARGIGDRISYAATRPERRSSSSRVATTPSSSTQTLHHIEALEHLLDQIQARSPSAGCSSSTSTSGRRASSFRTSACRS